MSGCPCFWHAMGRPPARCWVARLLRGLASVRIVFSPTHVGHSFAPLKLGELGFGVSVLPFVVDSVAFGSSRIGRCIAFGNSSLSTWPLVQRASLLLWLVAEAKHALRCPPVSGELIFSLFFAYFVKNAGTYFSVVPAYFEYFRFL